MNITAIREQVGRGEYEVDTHAVAEAIVRRILGERATRATCKGSPSA